MGHKMGEHCGRMAATCRQMLAAQPNLEHRTRAVQCERRHRDLDLPGLHRARRRPDAAVSSGRESDQAITPTTTSTIATTAPSSRHEVMMRAIVLTALLIAELGRACDAVVGPRETRPTR
jgi:hypothetical protein